MTRNFKTVIIDQNQFNLIAEDVSSHLHYEHSLMKGEYVALFGDMDEKFENPIHLIITDNISYPEYIFKKIDENDNELSIAEVINNVAKIIFFRQMMDMRCNMAMAGYSPIQR